ncbi:hypothetical protein AB0H03_06720 [Streptomyces sparsogenes]|uniref:hypothetical protein n=1 Tax=Streptomyces sparsogenes TaxID=67365 RepID=UPI0033F4D3D9
MTKPRFIVEATYRPSRLARKKTEVASVESDSIDSAVSETADRIYEENPRLKGKVRFRAFSE